MSSRAFQFYVGVDGYALCTKGFVEEWSVPAGRITPTGLLTFGFIIGLGDFWYYDENIANANWVDVDL